jgi:enterochelin esterase-like enzyme
VTSAALEGPKGSPARRASAIAAAVVGALLFALLGAVGLYRYLDNYWLYRGFPPPRDPAFVRDRGTVQRFYVASEALGGRRQPVDVYLPPGYATHPHVRYPVFYLLHGVPGRPGAFLQTVRLGVVEDILLARHRMRPMILVMPFGSTGSFTDKEWANGVHPHEGWETFVSRDLVAAVDARYRTIRSGSARALGGLSEGGYGALNIGLHHPGRFQVLESWSGYERADDVRSIFGGSPAVLRWNSPSALIGARARALRTDHSFVWFYTASGDTMRAQNTSFARQLRNLGVAHKFTLYRGGHDWALWRAQAADALLAASRHLGARNTRGAPRA